MSVVHNGLKYSLIGLETYMHTQFFRIIKQLNRLLNNGSLTVALLNDVVLCFFYSRTKTT